jgi:hypothetical protein
MPQNVLKGSRSIIYNLLFLGYIVSLALPIPNFGHVLSILCLLALLFSFAGIGRFYQLVVVLTLAFSFTLLFLFHLQSWEIIYHFSSLTNIMVLIAYAAIFCIPVHLGMYPRKLYLHFKSKVSSFRSLYATYSITTYMLCSVMSSSAIPTVRSSLYLFLRNLPEHFRKEFQAVTFVRPFILVTFWTPVALAPTVALEKTGANALIVMPILFAISILYLIMDIQTAHWRFKKKLGNVENAATSGEKQGSASSRKTKISLAIFIVTLLLFMVIVISVSHLFAYSILDAVVLMIIPYSFLWSLSMKRGKRYLQALARRFKEDVPKVSTQVALFVSVGFMINVVNMTGLSREINTLVSYLHELTGPFVLILISILIVAMTWIGILPQLVVVFVTQTLNTQQLGLNTEWFVLAVVGAALSGSAWSPFSVNANIVSVMINDTPMNVVNKNVMFSINLLWITSFLAVFLQYFYS